MRSLLYAVAALAVALMSLAVSGALSTASTADVLMLMTALGCVLLVLGGRLHASPALSMRPSGTPLRAAAVLLWLVTAVVLVVGALLVGPSFGLRSFLLVAVPSTGLILLSCVYLWNDGRGVGASDASPKVILVGDGAYAPPGWVTIVLGRPAEPATYLSAPCDVHVGPDRMASLLPGGTAAFCVTPGRHPVSLVFSGCAGPVAYVEGRAGEVLRFDVRRRETAGLLARFLRPGESFALRRVVSR